MIFPIQATYVEKKTVAVDRDNPEHEKYYSKGEVVFEQVDRYEGLALGYEIFDVITMKQNGQEEKVSREYILFAEDIDGEVGLSFVDMSSVRINTETFNKAVKRAVQTA